MMGIRHGLYLSALLLVMASTLSAAEKRSIIAPGIEKVIHANGSVEYRQIEQQSVVPVLQTVVTAPVPNLQEEPAKVVGSQPAAQRAGKIYKFRDTSGIVTYQSRKPEQGVAYIEFKPRTDCFACITGSSRISWETTPLFSGRYEKEIAHYAGMHGVSPALVKAVIHAESAFNPQARSSVGAQGLMQLMPATAAELGVASPFEPEQNIDGGVRYLAMLLKMYNNDVRLATAAYNAGPGAVRRYNGVPAYPETRAYVQRVAILERRYRQEG